MRPELVHARISRPLTDSRDEWAEAFMDLAKLIVEGFKPKVVRATLIEKGMAFEKSDGSIRLLERLLAKGKEIQDSDRLVGLRTAQKIRSKVKGHTGGNEAEQLTHDALAEHETFTAHFDHICGAVSGELARIESFFKPQNLHQDK